MFGWFAPKCPVKTWQKTWTETRMRWLADRFGIERLLKADVILPNDHYFPGEYRGVSEDAVTMMRRLCHYMEVDADKLELEVVPDEKLREEEAAGTYRRGERRSLIQVVQSKLAEPQALAATLAHEIAHEMLLGAGLLHGGEPDHELVTDLLPVFLGVGIFAANSVITEESWSTALSSGWRISRLGYLPPSVFGYAFALFAFMRNEHSPTWARHLCPSASSAFRAGLRYLGKTNDSVFHPGTIRDARQPLSPATAIAGLRHESATVRLATLWDLRSQPLEEAEVVAATAACLDDPDPHLPGEAAQTLAALGDAAAGYEPRLLCAAESPNLRTQLGAIAALGALQALPEQSIPLLVTFLDEPAGGTQVIQEAAQALSRFGAAAEPVVPQMLDLLPEALRKDHDYKVDSLLRALLVLSPNLEQRIRDHFQGSDRATCRRALKMLAELRQYLAEGGV